MPSKSKAQQKFMGMVHALQKGDMKPSDASPAVKKVAQSMKKKDAKDFASTSHKGLPRKVKQEIINRLKEYANKMGTDHLGGDDYTSSKKGGLRDFDGYDNVDYNPNMKMEGPRPQNWMSGRTSDYHTKLRGKEREYDDTNFEKDNSGQPDLEEAGLKGTENIPSNKKLSKLSDNEKLNILQSSGNIISFHIPDWAKGRYKMWQVISAGKIKKKKDLDGEIIYFLPGKGPQKASPTYPTLKDLLNGVDWENMEMRRESVNESFDKVEHLKLLNLALRTMPGSQKQKEVIRKLNKVRKAGGMRPLKEDLEDVIYQVKKFDKPKDEKLLTIKVINKLKDKRNKSKSSSNKQKLQKMIDKIEGDYKKGKYIKEYASNQTLSFLPLDQDEIDKMNEGTMVRRAVDIAQELLPKDTWSRYASDGKKNAEFVKNIVRDLARSLNQFYKNYNINVRIHK